MIGVDSNVAGMESLEFQKKLSAAGFDFGTPRDQVTVAKQRSLFQTQVKKAGETDVSHKAPRAGAERPLRPVPWAV